MASKKGFVYVDDDEIKSMKVKNLKDYLRRFGQYVTGNKEALIERAMDVRKLNLKDKMMSKWKNVRGIRKDEMENGQRHLVSLFLTQKD